MHLTNFLSGMLTPNINCQPAASIWINSSWTINSGASFGLNKYRRIGFQHEILFGCNITYSPWWLDRKLFNHTATADAQGTPQYSPHSTVFSHYQKDPSILISLSLLHTKSLNHMKIQILWDTDSVTGQMVPNNSKNCSAFFFRVKGSKISVWLFFQDFMTLKTNALWSFKLSGTTHPMTWHHTEDSIIHQPHHYDSLKSHNESEELVNNEVERKGRKLQRFNMRYYAHTCPKGLRKIKRQTQSW
jgi:hypothetical protein